MGSCHRVPASCILNRDSLNDSFTLKMLPIHEAHSSSYLRLKFMSMKGRLAQNIYIVVGGRTNSPFPVGALKVAVSSRSEGSGWGGGGGYASVVLESPNFDLTNSSGSFHSWQELRLCCSGSSLATVKCWGGGGERGEGFGTTWALLGFRLNL